MGLNEVVPLTTDRHASFKAAVATSVAACGAEAATYADSAYTRLSGRALTALAVGDYSGQNAWVNTVPPDRQAAWNAIFRVYDAHHLVVPSAGAVDALWVVDPVTGVAKAVLLDSTGGAILTGGCKLDAFDAEALVIAELALFCSAEGVLFLIFCAGINVAASGMCVIALFNGHADLGTPLGAIQPWLGLGEAGLGGLDAALGMILIALTLASAGCI